MSDAELVLRSTRVITPGGTRAASVAVTDSTITAVLPHQAPVPDGARLEDLGDDVLLPGRVDTHVHVNDPGRTEWEGFWTATRAAAAGGITTLIDMPLNSLPPTTTVGHLRTKQRAAADRPTSTSASGAAPCPTTPRTCARCTRPASSASRPSCHPPASTSSRTSARSNWPAPSPRSPPSTVC